MTFPHGGHIVSGPAHRLSSRTGPTATAALITGAYRPAPGERVAVVITGANTTLSDFQTPSASEPS